MSVPLIAVAGRRLGPGTVPGWRQEGAGVPAPYVRALQRAGGQEAVLLPVETDAESAVRRLQRFDGLLLIGGGDVDPVHYGERRHPRVYGVEPIRDAFELALARAAVELGCPTLAICRGSQVLNVALGGSLIQHLDGHGDPSAQQPVTHRVTLEPDSRVATAVGVDRPTCSCHHHQALARLGEGLVATGWAEDGLVEAVEHRESWLVGVQWHPEETAHRDPAQQALFDALVRRAADGAGRAAR